MVHPTGYDSPRNRRIFSIPPAVIIQDPSSPLKNRLQPSPSLCQSKTVTQNPSGRLLVKLQHRLPCSWERRAPARHSRSIPSWDSAPVTQEPSCGSAFPGTSPHVPFQAWVASPRCAQPLLPSCLTVLVVQPMVLLELAWGLSPQESVCPPLWLPPGPCQDGSDRPQGNQDAPGANSCTKWPLPAISTTR